MHISPNIPFRLTPEVLGERQDFRLLEEDKWLINTEVVYLLQKWKGLWHLSMVYIALDNPFKLICRKISTYTSEKKAVTFAEILLRGIRKDARGTLKSNQDAFNICAN